MSHAMNNAKKQNRATNGVGSGELVSCPFCGENDFDQVGLKMHLSFGHCDNYNALSVGKKPHAFDMPEDFNES